MYAHKMYTHLVRGHKSRVRASCERFEYRYLLSLLGLPGLLPHRTSLVGCGRRKGGQRLPEKLNG